MAKKNKVDSTFIENYFPGMFGEDPEVLKEVADSLNKDDDEEENREAPNYQGA